MPHINSPVDFGKALDTLMTNTDSKPVPHSISDLPYDSYACQRDYGMSHEDCMRIGLGKEEYKERYNN